MRKSPLCLVLFSLLAAAIASGQTDRPAGSKPATPDPWLAKLARFLGISRDPPSLLQGREEEELGTIWVAPSDGGRKLRQLTPQADYAWPIFAADGASLYAVRGKEVIGVPFTGGSETVLCTVPGLLKLVGADTANADQILIVRRNGADLVASVLSLRRGSFDDLAGLSSDSLAFQHLLGSRRIYGDKTLITEEPGPLRKPAQA